MKILKFGGSSVAQPERIRNVSSIVESYREKGTPFCIVVSALGGITDLLVEMSYLAAQGDTSYKSRLKEVATRHFSVAKSLLSKQSEAEVMEALKDAQEELGNLLHGIFLVKELTPRTLDYILSFGERLSAFIISRVLNHHDLPAEMLDARKVILTNDTFGQAKVNIGETYKNIYRYFQEHSDKIQVITGFIGATAKGETTTLGRGGSDYSASLFGSALNVEVIEIWTDVAGVMTADPGKVRKALPVPNLTFQEALEMSHFGAKVIYPATIIPAMEKNIPIRIKSTFEPDKEGTLISNSYEPDQLHPVKGISSIGDVSLLMVQGAALVGAVAGNISRLFKAMAQYRINIILITQGSSEHSICFAVKPDLAETAKKAIEEEFELELQARYIEPVIIETGISVLAVIGEDMKSHPGISARLFTALGKNGINVIVTSQGSSERNISVAIHKKDEVKALNAVHENFFLSDTYSLNLFIVGVGQVGGTLLQQIREHAEFLRTSQHVEMNIVALANSKKMLFYPEGINLENWQDQLNNSEEKMDIEEYVQRMIRLNLRNSIFVDNTADARIAEQYERILDNSISISTPNKMAPSGNYRAYQDLKKLAYDRGVKFMYETNVGAGLPVITTITDLVNSGDQIRKIEGVLSGSLSYIFNTFGPEKSFSSVVEDARKLGFTEPDPREDLSGADVTRKLTILARESGLALEREGIELENILPQACLDAPTVKEFFVELKANDAAFEARRKQAEEAGKVLRFIAEMNGSKATITLREVDPDSPFYHLSGSDNMIVFTTSRYKDRPLVIKGPGAGAEVTAAGVFAEIIRIGYYLS